MIIAFYTLAAVMLASLLFILFTPKVMHAVFCLVLTFLSLAGMYVLLEASFVASAQIMIYVGGILILLVFGVMMTQRSSKENQPMVHLRMPWGSAALSLSLLGLLLYAFWDHACLWADKSPKVHQGLTQQLGVALMTDYLLVFEMMAVLLMIGLMGASLLAHQSQ